MATNDTVATMLLESRLADGARGNPEAYYDLGVAYSTGSAGLDHDLIQAHKFFNLAALGGSVRGQRCRAEIAGEMSREEIAEAQRQARSWLARHARPPILHRRAA